MLTTDKTQRKQTPMATGVLDYFPDAIAAVARVSHVGNEQHNPGEPLHWDREKSKDHADCIVRHMADRGQIDDDGQRHSAKVAWRALAMLQIELEEADEIAEPERECLRDMALAALDDPQVEEYYTGLMDSTAAPIPDVLETALAVVEEAAKAEAKRIFYTNCLGESSCCLDDVVEDELWGRKLKCSERCDVVMYLRDQGCKEEVAVQIAEGFTLPIDWPTVTCLGKTESFGAPTYSCVYLSGPMRGYPHLNFPAFDVYRDRFLQRNYAVLSPADIDRAAGEEDLDDDAVHTPEQQGRYAYRDFHGLLFLDPRIDAVAMMPEWERSTGAVAEFCIARWLGLPVLDAETGDPLDDVNVSALLVSLFTFLLKQQRDDVDVSIVKRVVNDLFA